MNMSEMFWGCDEPTIQYRWEYDIEDFPEVIRVNEFVNDQLREILEVKEDVVRKAAIAILRVKGYTVIEPDDGN